MNINQFAVEVTKLEGKKIEVNIAQVKEIMKAINILTRGLFYAVIKWLS